MRAYWSGLLRRRSDRMRDCELRVAALRYVETIGPDLGDDQEDDGDGHRSAASEYQTQLRVGGGTRDRGQAHDDSGGRTSCAVRGRHGSPLS